MRSIDWRHVSEGRKDGPDAGILQLTHASTKLREKTGNRRLGRLSRIEQKLAFALIHT